MPADLDYLTLINPAFTDVGFHILISFILALIVNVKLRHKYWVYITAAIGINGLIDADHLISSFFGDVNIFHNMFVFVLIPLVVYGLAFLYGQKEGRGIYPAAALMLFTITLSHMYLDVAAGTPIFLQYPLSTTKFIFNPSITMNSGFVVLRTQETALIILGLLGLAFNRVAAYHMAHTYGEEQGTSTQKFSIYTVRKVVDRKMVRIIYLLAIKVLAPHEITAITGIPLAEVYRRIHILVHLGIVEVKGIRYIRGRRIQFYGVVPGRVLVRNGEIYLLTH
ncbi:MAG: winged helix-turn-helix domain-containing protein [Thermoplasmata archaeon]|nr:winged helix-turn-helix domain-containing protein [Thermoplasmata archaeon]